jgi:biopolymer transport protein ExbD
MGAMGHADAHPRRRRARPITGINITPMVDVMLILLVIMMVASTYIVSQTLKVELPRAKTTDGSTQSPTKVTAKVDGTLLWNGEPIAEDALPDALAKAKAANQDLSLIISADRDVPHGKVVWLIDLARLRGIKKFAINVEHVQ